MSKTVLATGTQSVDRASALLINIMESNSPSHLGVLARTHDLPKSTASRLLSALERKGLLQRDHNGAFSPGNVLTTFAREQNQESFLVARIHPLLELLSAKTGETANLAIPGIGYVNLLDQVDGQYLLGATNWVGKQVPYHASALGKVLLAYSAVSMPPGRLERRTNTTITSRANLLSELESVRKMGYAIIADELEEGLVAVAAPIREPDGRTIGAISISGPSFRISVKELHNIGKIIVSEIGKVDAL